MSYVRQENGQYYVMRESKDKKLERQNIQTGKIIDGGSAIEILSGISQEDYICFPYGNMRQRVRWSMRPTAHRNIKGGTEYAGKHPFILTGHFVP